MKKVALHNLGCKVNAYETDSMKQQLIEAGYDIVPFGEFADVYVINTCTVTNIADRKSRQMLHRAKKYNPQSIVVATGCYAQSSKEELEVDPCIDIILGNNNKGKIVEILNAYENEKQSSLLIDINAKCEYEDLSITKVTGHTRAYIKIQDGCNHFCSYCIIPYARGRVRSRRLASIKQEVTALADNGVKEIVLTGIQLSAYGFDFEKGLEKLIDVIESLADIDGIERIRLGSLEPNIITEDFIKRVSRVDKFCPHFHLSLQSGSDSVLKRMNRHYDANRYLSACELIREYFEMPAITTDIIVGFPGETDEEFDETIAFVKKVKLAQTHIFKYSKRKGTRAAEMDNQVDDNVKHKRSTTLIDVCRELEKDFLEKFIGTEEEVLLEENATIDGKVFTYGHTKNYVKVALAGNLKSNEIIKVKIKELDDEEYILKAERIE